MQRFRIEKWGGIETMAHKRDTARSAMEAALGRARQNTTTAALVLALVPLAAVPAMAAPATPDVSIITTIGSDLNGATITYEITNNSGYSLSEIEIPEINAGDLKFRVEEAEQPGLVVNSLNAVGGAPFLPGGWSGTENTSAQLGASVPGGSPSDFLDLITGFEGAQIRGSGGTGSFTFDITTTSTIEANIADRSCRTMAGSPAVSRSSIRRS